MTNLSSVKEEIRIAVRTVESFRDRFSTFGLEYLGAQTEQSNLAGDSAVFLFRHVKSGVLLRLSVFPSIAAKKRSAVVILTNRRGQTLNVNDYLTVHKQEETRSEFVADRASADIGTFVEHVVNALLNLLAADLRTVLEGRHWEDIPIDWAGYR